MVTKDDLAAVIAQLASLKAEIVAINARLDAQLPQFATKAELQEVRSELRAWIVASFLSMLTILGSIQYYQYSVLKSYLDQRLDAIVTVIEAQQKK
jgi:hypothetical protein